MKNIRLSNAIQSLNSSQEFVIRKIPINNLSGINTNINNNEIIIEWYSNGEITGITSSSNSSYTSGGPFTFDEIIAEKTRLESELPLKILRQERDLRLSETDKEIVQLLEYLIKNNKPIGISTVWDTYRQQLRDLPQTVENPSNPVWPTPPTNDEIVAEIIKINTQPNWRNFLQELKLTNVFQTVRLGSRSNVEINAIATELRTLIGEAALGFPEIELIQNVLNELILNLNNDEINEINQLIISNNLPVGVGTT